MLRQTMFAGLLAMLACVGVSVAEDKKADDPNVIKAEKAGPVEAKVGQTVLFGVKNSSAIESLVSGVKVKVNGKKVDSPETKTYGPIGGGFYCFVFKASKPGKYKVEVTPVYMKADRKGGPVKFELTVKE